MAARAKLDVHRATSSCVAGLACSLQFAVCSLLMRGLFSKEQWLIFFDSKDSPFDEGSLGISLQG